MHGRIGKTNRTSNTAFRGFGGPQGMIVIEDILGRCAPLLGVAPEELRRSNFYEPGQATPYGQPVRHAERLADIWAILEPSAATSHARKAEVAAFNAAHPDTKRALAMTPVKFGISFNLTAFNQAGALVHVYKDGSVLINHGGAEMGQGLHTKMIQVAATALGVPLSYVRLAPTRTDKVPNTSATAASSGADLNGGAIKNACDQIRAAAATWSPPASSASTPTTSGSSTAWSPASASTTSRSRGPNWCTTPTSSGSSCGRPASTAPPGCTGTPTGCRASRSSTSPTAPRCSEVEVDGFTGAYRLRRADIVHDVGDSLSPLIDIGQIEGGFVQGAGWLTLEELRWDTSDGPNRGRLNTQAASTYKIPSFSEMPEEFNVHLFERATESGVVYGSKAVGEPPLMQAFSVREALRAGRRRVRPAPASRSTWAARPPRRRCTGRSRPPRSAGGRRIRPAAHRTVRPPSTHGTGAGGGLTWTGSAPSSSCAGTGSPACWSR